LKKFHNDCRTGCTITFNKKPGHGRLKLYCQYGLFTKNEVKRVEKLN
jgi:hypothetical protein